MISKRFGLEQSKKRETISRKLSRKFTSTHNMTAEEEEKTLSIRQRTLDELVETERTYVKHLRMVVEGHIQLVKNPVDDIPVPDNWNVGDLYKIFGNLESIYKWHRDIFLKQLEKCSTDVNLLGRTYEIHERKMMSMYTRYSHNHDKQKTAATEKFEEYLERLTKKLNYSQQLDELLHKPIQRITVYHLMMDRIHQYTKKLKRPTELESVQRALKVVKDLPRNIDVMMKFRDIMRYKDDNEDHGKVVYHGLLFCVDLEGKKSLKKWNGKTVYVKGELFMVYLFEKNMLFNVVVGKNAKKQPKCFYRNHIPVNNMLFGRVPNCPNTFTVRSSGIGLNPKDAILAYTCRAETPESYTEWMSAIEEVSAQLYRFAVDLQNPMLAQESQRSDSGR
ncbi:hypothetical protein GE061_004262 [Apolygus lucorum]|uniref:DH domain-containing protein n=1 Tax=Apolygus lucorum TaxID=248454 RepID=A0A8S9X1B1_APOLU|nr:hypothetical protein GE061_004262 [Apolygus lucorum]